jgi:uncharacterized protein YbgA (DUF1722 family)
LGNLRVWDIHPGYLSRQSLLGQHAEIHAIYSIITGGKKGYASHPETLRWKEHLWSLERRHALTVKEMSLRAMGHHSPIPKGFFKDSSANKSYVDKPAEQFAILTQKYTTLSVIGRIPLPRRGSEFWSHHKYSVMARGYGYYKEIQAFMGQKKDLSIAGESELIQRILTLLEEPFAEKELPNLMEHLWGYVKNEANSAEREVFKKYLAEDPLFLLDYLYKLAEKYGRPYLLSSTVFADLPAPAASQELP